jgi:hypothetical protein
MGVATDALSTMTDAGGRLSALFLSETERRKGAVRVGFSRFPGNCAWGPRRSRTTENPTLATAWNRRQDGERAMTPDAAFFEGKQEECGSVDRLRSEHACPKPPELVMVG